jgi:hypothetical protein
LAALLPLVVLAFGCATESPSQPDVPTPEAPDDPPPAPPVPAESFRWGSATPESQGMCGTTRQLGCTKTLEEIWQAISDPKHNTKRFIVIRNDKDLYDRGSAEPHPSYSAY